ncbi:MAG: carboxypeptidase-like regulatory domain-containing protein [Rhodanobacter sp.]
MRNCFRAKILPLVMTALLAATPVFAQDTSSWIAGRVLDASGQPVVGATVQIVDVPKGTTKVTTTDSSGHYAAQGLRIGGPFDVTVTKAGMPESGHDNVYLQLGPESAINLTMGAAQAKEVSNLAGVMVSASALAQTFSPHNESISTNISQRELEAAPTPGGRALADFHGVDPATGKYIYNIDCTGAKTCTNDIQSGQYSPQAVPTYVNNGDDMAQRGSVLVTVKYRF